ncbi:MAG: Arc family DNA-binding protein [Alloalcanivorax venustensis]|jgi:hypothetical protein|uniref:Arc family DNA-binding protein n=1 Tax=Alloalcanivorax TaxID=3020832 RepID=UPI000C46879F|nr:transcriptional regulator [Alcanivorax sp.]MED5602974.1 Arc family DNA-binding protein [Pseudomonadota bacterium]MBL4722520.1 Arc family DNA-binding protein [Alcanivorax sp.]QVL43514.1 MAG: Arc family DNA-binding protein [Alcanivorax sp.]HBM24738.1 transcriptional regulator [Alcanivorax sp.]|tara:strand:+ start:350 stop:640 length:291 start_codon:yes stop_codon:yes gene_type:complete
MKQAERTRSEKFVVRFPLGMRDWVAQAAGVSHRSMNAEIVARLRHSMDNWPDQLPGDEPAVPAGDEERFLLDHFRRLPAAKRRALIALLDGNRPTV